VHDVCQLPCHQEGGNVDYPPLLAASHLSEVSYDALQVFRTDNKCDLANFVGCFIGNVE
jgi:hypothetical protein